MNPIVVTIDALFFALCAICFGCIIYYNISETSKARKRFRAHERDKGTKCT